MLQAGNWRRKRARFEFQDEKQLNLGLILEDRAALRPVKRLKLT
jgi:hypothetical protein